MLMDTYNAFLTTQYYFKTHNTDAFKLLCGKDPVTKRLHLRLRGLCLKWWYIILYRYKSV